MCLVGSIYCCNFLWTGSSSNWWTFFLGPKKKHAKQVPGLRKRSKVLEDFFWKGSVGKIEVWVGFPLKKRLFLQTIWK